VGSVALPLVSLFALVPLAAEVDAAAACANAAAGRLNAMAMAARMVARVALAGKVEGELKGVCKRGADIKKFETKVALAPRDACVISPGSGRMVIVGRQTGLTTGRDGWSGKKYADCIANENACYLNHAVNTAIQRLRNNFGSRKPMHAQRKLHF
jgi:hypothetical protein